MADLSTISTSSPADADSVSDGANKIRETRDAIITSFSGADAGAGSTLGEHYKKGAHKFPAGDGSATGFSGAPTFGNANRIFLDTTNKRLLRDTGATWALLNTSSPQASIFTVSTATAVGYVDVVSFTVNVVTNAMVKLEALIQIIGVAGGTVTVRGYLDGTTTMLSGERSTTVAAGATIQLHHIDVKTGLSAGNHTVAFQIKGNSSSTALYDQCLALVTLL